MKEPTPHRGTGSLSNRLTATTRDSLPQPTLANTKEGIPRQGLIKASSIVPRIMEAFRAYCLHLGVTIEGEEVSDG